jgi:hypothetical protein
MKFPALSSALLASAFFIFFNAAPSAHAQAPQCTFNISNISFGTVDVKNGHPYDATGTFNYACTGDSRQIVRILPQPGYSVQWPTMDDRCGG